jgi:hypothetical protein
MIPDLTLFSIPLHDMLAITILKPFLLKYILFIAGNPLEIVVEIQLIPFFGRAAIHSADVINADTSIG